MLLLLLIFLCFLLSVSPSEPPALRDKRSQAQVNWLAINERRSLEVGAGPKGMRLA